MKKITNNSNKEKWICHVKNILQWLGDNSGCHQIPERSFFIHGWQFPLCARCTGATVGQFAAVVSVFLKKVVSVPVALVCLTVMGIDWGIQEAGIQKSTNTRRFVTGFLGGFGLFSLYVHGIRRLIRKFREIRKK